MSEIRDLINALDHAGLHTLLSQNPSLANAGIPFDKKNQTLAHPLHRICDGVFNGAYTDDQGVEIAKIFLEHGSNVDGYGFVIKKDTPLITASSLNAENVGLLYIDRGADIHHAGTHGGTALHWAAWTGRDKLVDKLIRSGADIHKKCLDFNSTPLLWVVHGYKFEGGRNRHHQVECARLLLAAGAERNTSNKDGQNIVDLLDAQDSALREMLRN
jgi:ankyrin repeat protein